MVRQTSIESFTCMLPRLGNSQMAVYRALRHLEAATDQEIAKHLEYDDLNKVRPRRFELMQEGIVKEIARRDCHVTGKRAIVWAISLTPQKIESKALTHTQMQSLKTRLAKASPKQRQILTEYIKEVNDERLRTDRNNRH